MRRVQLWMALTAAVAIGSTLVGCAPDRSIPMPVPTSSATSSASPKPYVPEIPTFHPGGTALVNYTYFDYVNKKLFASNPKPGGKAIIENLVAAGFDKAAMQITPDKTSVLHLDADSIVFSVLTSKDCLIGQISGHGYRSMIGPESSEGVCLAGKTEAIE